MNHYLLKCKSITGPFYNNQDWLCHTIFPYQSFMSFQVRRPVKAFLVTFFRQETIATKFCVLRIFIHSFRSFVELGRRALCLVYNLIGWRFVGNDLFSLVPIIVNREI